MSRERWLHGNYAREKQTRNFSSFPRIKLLESFPSDPLSSRSDNESKAATSSLSAKPSRFSLLSRLHPPSPSSSRGSSLLRLHLSSFLQPKANIPADNTEDPIVQTAPAVYVGLAGEMKYAAKRHVQSVRQVVRQIKRDSHPDGFVSKQTDEYEVTGLQLCQAPCNNSSFKGKCVCKYFKVISRGTERERESHKDCLTLRANNFKFVGSVSYFLRFISLYQEQFFKLDFLFSFS